ncbi:cysteine-rich protein 1-like isoform X1 [Penaeus vannamei]|uniref:cysteine-rich protein 1-like isoform X1 n=1 Tax=Penaeus vannamei TaxID=6689 RepID=UPI00387F5A92
MRRRWRRYGACDAASAGEVEPTHPSISFQLRSITAERKSSLGKDWHAFCLKCEKCNKTLTPGSHAEHEGKPYCTTPCYGALFGPGGYGRGGTQSFVYDKK